MCHFITLMHMIQAPAHALQAATGTRAITPTATACVAHNLPPRHICAAHQAQCSAPHTYMYIYGDYVHTHVCTGMRNSYLHPGHYAAPSAMRIMHAAIPHTQKYTKSEDLKETSLPLAAQVLVQRVYVDLMGPTRPSALPGCCGVVDSAEGGYVSPV